MFQKISKKVHRNFAKNKKRYYGEKLVVPEPYLKVNVDTKDFYAISKEELKNRTKPFKEYLENSRLKPEEIPIPMSPSLRPYLVETLKVGQKYHWCSCGMSANQPFCDNSHKRTKFSPVSFVLHEQIQRAYLCGCKHSTKKPFCDGQTCLDLRNNQKPTKNQL